MGLREPRSRKIRSEIKTTAPSLGVRLERKAFLSAGHTGLFPQGCFSHTSVQPTEGAKQPTAYHPEGLHVPLPFLQGEIAACIQNCLHQSPLFHQVQGRARDQRGENCEEFR